MELMDKILSGNGCQAMQKVHSYNCRYKQVVRRHKRKSVQSYQVVKQRNQNC